MTVYINPIWMHAEDYCEVRLLAACFTSGLGQLFGKVCSRFYGPDCHLFPVILSVFVSYHWNMLSSNCVEAVDLIQCLEDSMGLVSLENIGNICNFIITV